MFKRFCPEASFINISTNKVYGDNPNKLDLIEGDTRFELNKNLYITQMELTKQ